MQAEGGRELQGTTPVRKRWGRTQEPVWLVCSGRNMDKLEEWAGAKPPFARPRPGDPVGQQSVGTQRKDLLCEEGLIGALLQE